MSRGVLAILLLCGSLLAAEPAWIKVARDFNTAHRARNRPGMMLLAAQPALEVPYALVENWLLRNGEPGTAEALAEFRGGPEKAGLARMLKTYRSGHRASQEQLATLAAARGLITRGKTGAAGHLLDRLGDPVEGTLLGVRICWERARLHARGGENRLAAASLGRCARLARAIGWLTRWRDAEQGRLARGAGREAADGWVEACRLLEDDPNGLEAHRARAKLLLALANKKTDPKRREALTRQARVDYAAAIEIAERLGRKKDAALLRFALAIVWHRREQRPRQALELYRQAEKDLAALGEERLLAAARLNIAVALRQMGRFKEALEVVDALAGASVAPPEAIAERAYLLMRLGRLEQAVAAYREALAANPAGVRRVNLLVQCGDLQLDRGDLDAARRNYRRALLEQPGLAAARVGLARVAAASGDERSALSGLDAVLAKTSSSAEKLRLLLLRAALLRSWGRVPEALASAERALGIVKAAKGTEDYGNAAALYLVLGDLKLLEGDFEGALAAVRDGGTLFFRLNDPGRAAGAYVREVLLLIMLKRMDEATERLQVLLNRIAGPSPSDRLKSSAKTCEAIFEARDGRPDHAVKLLLEAQELARKAHDPLREATALVHRALIGKRGGLELVDKALGLLAGRRVAGPEEQPLVEGERPDHAAAIGLSLLLEADAMPDAERAAKGLRYMERARADRLLVALGGRDAFLRATLGPRLREAYLAARGKLVEARAEGRGIAEAEKAFDLYVGRLRKEAPGVAAIAFAVAPDLEAVQAALGEHEVFLDFLVDPYARAVLAVGKRHTLLAPFEPNDPLGPLAALLTEKPELVAAPDGLWAARPLGGAPWQGGLAFDAFRIRYVTSAAALVRRRAAGKVSPGQGGAALGAAPARFAAWDRKTRPAVLHVGLFGTIDFAHPQASGLGSCALNLLGQRFGADLVVLAGAQARVRRKSALPLRGEAIAALVEALGLDGAGAVLLSLGGPPPERLLQRFYRGCLDQGLDFESALRAAKVAYRSGGGKGRPVAWQGLVLYGTAVAH